MSEFALFATKTALHATQWILLASRTLRPSRTLRLAVVAMLIFWAVVPANGAQAQSTPPLADNYPVARTVLGHLLPGTVAEMDGDYDAAAIYLARAAFERSDEPGIVGRAFTLTLAAGMIDQAMVFGKRLTVLDPKNHAPSLALAVQAMAKGENRTAGLILDASGSSPFEKLTTVFLSAWNRVAIGDFDGALKKLSEKSSDPLMNYFQAYHRGLIADLSGNSELAVTAFKQALDLDAGSLRLSEAYARALWRANQHDKASKYLNDLVANARSAPQLKVLQAAFAANGSVAPIVTSAKAGASELLNALGETFGSEGPNVQAAALLQLALLLDPTADTPRVSLANFYDKNGRIEAANRQLSAISKSSPFAHAARIEIAVNTDKLGKLDEAKGVLNKMLADDPKDVTAIMVLGNLLRAHNDFAGAEAAYTQAIAVTSSRPKDDFEGYFNRGICRERLGRWQEAEPDFLKALQLAPGQPEVLNYLAYTWVDKGVNYDKALAMLQQAVSRAPNDGYIVDSLGWAYYKLGRYKEAVTTMERAVDLKTGDPTLNEHLGDVYWRSGRRLEAQYQWRKAKDLKPTEPGQLEGLTKKLQEGLPDAVKAVSAEAAPAKVDASAVEVPKPDPAKADAPAVPAPASDPAPKVPDPQPTSDPAKPAAQ